MVEDITSCVVINYLRMYKNIADLKMDTEKFCDGYYATSSMKHYSYFVQSRVYNRLAYYKFLVQRINNSPLFTDYPILGRHKVKW